MTTGRPGCARAQLGEEVDAVAVLQAHVEQHAVDAAAGQRRPRLDHALDAAGAEAAAGGEDGADQALADGAIVVDDEDRRHRITGPQKEGDCCGAFRGEERP